MKAPEEKTDRWERTLSRYFSANGLPLQWNYKARRFLGIARHTFARINPRQEHHTVNAWVKMPDRLRRFESDGNNAVILVTNKRYGDDVEDSIVVMRLGTFMPMLKAMYNNDKERWTAHAPLD